MGTRPTPVVVCGAMAAHSQAALAAGAVDVVGALDALPSSPQYVTAMRRHLRVASRVRVITHPRNRLRAKGADRPPRTDGRAAGALPAAADQPSTRNIRVVVIGASTGGPPALATILADLPADLPVPVLVVQHMADGFVEGLATWLDGLSPLPVVMARRGHRLQPGMVHVAPAGVNTLLGPGLRVDLTTPPEGQFHVPGVDAAFASAAATCGAHGPRRPAHRHGPRRCHRAAHPSGRRRHDDRPGRTDQRGVGDAGRGAGPRRRRDRAAAAGHRGRHHRRRLRRRGGAGVKTLRDEDFEAVRSYLLATAGLVFDQSRRAGMSGVVADRLRVTGAPDVTTYLAMLDGEAGDGRAAATARRCHRAGDAVLPERPADGGAARDGCCPSCCAVRPAGTAR